MARNLSILAVVAVVLVALVVPGVMRDPDDAIVETGSNGEGLVLMKFGAPWCPPCQMIDKELDTLDTAARIVKVNVDESPQLAAKYNVSSIPRLYLLRDGKVIGDRTGFLSAAELTRWINDSGGQLESPGEVQQNPFVE